MKLTQICPSLIRFLEHTGAYGVMLYETLRGVRRRGIEVREILRQIVLIGVNSVPIVLLTGLFTGMVLALQTAYGLERFGAKNYVGNITGLGFVRELGPILTAIVICGRVGAGIAAEIASMVVTEQVDAMRALGANPYQKLVAPRVLAAMISTPLLVVLANCVGIYGGLLVAVYELEISSHLYLKGLLYTIIIRDVTDGMLKSIVFGFLVVSLACFKGLRAHGGTEGVGLTTTSAVVTGVIVIFCADFFLTKLLLVF
jgi:phospholipid/cholesterol/gamma-HCH transport system permease protein